MRRGLAGRLDRLARTAMPGRCRWHAGSCVQHAVVGDGSDDPPDPELPDTCAGCGRPILWQIVRVFGVDVPRPQ